MTNENKFKIGLCLQEIALSMDDATLEKNRERLKLIEDIIAGEQEPCTDAISRQAVLDVLCDLGWGCEETEYISALEDCAEKVKELPYVNPKEPKTESEDNA